jgi:hypothetical protein
MFQNSKLFISYKHIQAKTPEKLEQEMLQTQVASREAVTFSAPTYNNGNWHTWFLYDFSQDVRPQDKIKLNNTGGK